MLGDSGRLDRFVARFPASKGVRVKGIIKTPVMEIDGLNEVKVAGGGHF